jgi:deoxyribose-phosphate aldolase
VKKLCREAADNGFATVCVNGAYTAIASESLKGSGVGTCVVVGFPLGAGTTEAKAAETADAVASGADEVDMVINIGMLQAEEYEYVERDIRAVVEAAAGRTVKVIIEACYLTDGQKVQACLLSEKAGAHFVKTSTGFGPSGATVEDVALMKRTVPSLKVKAAGGIRDTAAAMAMVNAGADRIGASASLSIIGKG